MIRDKMRESLPTPDRKDRPGMKIFLDTANLDEIREGAALGVVDGVTTNPSLMAKEDGDYKEMLKEICDIVRGPVTVSYTHLRAHETPEHLVCRLLLEKK